MRRAPVGAATYDRRRQDRGGGGRDLGGDPCGRYALVDPFDGQAGGVVPGVDLEEDGGRSVLSRTGRRTSRCHPTLFRRVKVRDLVGLYLNPPDAAVVLCDESQNTEMQALDRTAPILPIMPGTPQRRTHDYKRRR